MRNHKNNDWSTLSARLEAQIRADLDRLDAMASIGYGVGLTVQPTQEPLLEDGFSDWYYERYTMRGR